MLIILRATDELVLSEIVHSDNAAFARKLFVITCRFWHPFVATRLWLLCTEE